MKWLRSLFGSGEKPASQVVASVQKEAGNVHVIRVGGVLSKATTDRIQAIAAQDFARGVKDLKVLIILSDFRGWRKGDDWGDIDFFSRYEENIARIAVVGEPRWESETLMFLGAKRRSGEVRYYTSGQEAQARAWLVS